MRTTGWRRISALDGNAAPFFGFQARNGETTPALTNGSGDLTRSPNITPTTIGGYNQTIRWSASWDAWDGPPIDSDMKYQISLCAVDDGTDDRLCGSGVEQTVDVTPRRVQAFTINSGEEYQWQNRSVPDGTLVASGTVTADGTNRITVPDVAVSPTGNRLILWPSDCTMQGTLSLTVEGAGKVTVSPQQEKYSCGQEVTLEASPDDGWAFTAWSGSVSGDSSSREDSGRRG